MTNDVLITALENIILDKVSIAPILQPRRANTSSPVDFENGRCRTQGRLGLGRFDSGREGESNWQRW